MTHFKVIWPHREKQTAFRDRSSGKMVSCEEQIISADKYPRIFSRQIEAIVFTIVQIFFPTRTVLKIGEYHSDIPQFWLGHIQSRGAFRPISHELKYLMDFKSNYAILYKYDDNDSTRACWIWDDYNQLNASYSPIHPGPPFYFLTTGVERGVHVVRLPKCQWNTKSK